MKNEISTGKTLPAKDVRRFIFYIAIIAICVAAMLYMLINAKPSISPKVKDTNGTSSLVTPAARAFLPARSA